MLFDTVVRYGQQHNPDYEAKNEGPPEAPLGKFSIRYTGLFSLFPVPCSLFPKNPELCT
ncbi:hypothetical protein [Moorena bouillonii]|uniref:hypothetical protein n=1 Tax=Moorena bouillonii TaxID=207920 RepID=UPI001300E7FA|nr:hypothetical protein [Moorena bouillonii]NEO48106.1 hypothetical protein [Moorena sp. SIO4A3]